MGSPHTSAANFYAWKIQNTDMNSASSLANKSVDIQKNWSTFKLLIAPESSGIKTVSLTAVQLIFDNSRFLSQKNGLVVPKPMLLMDLSFVLIVLIISTLTCLGK